MLISLFSGPSPSLLVSDRYDIRKLSINGLHTTLVHETRSVSAIAVDVRNKWIYWADSALKKIFKAHIGSSSEPIVIADVGKPEGLALDYSSGKLYWTDAGECSGLKDCPIFL